MTLKSEAKVAEIDKFFKNDERDLICIVMLP